MLPLKVPPHLTHFHFEMKQKVGIFCKLAVYYLIIYLSVMQSRWKASDSSAPECCAGASYIFSQEHRCFERKQLLWSPGNYLTTRLNQYTHAVV